MLDISTFLDEREMKALSTLEPVSIMEEYSEKPSTNFSWPPGQVFPFEPLPPYPAGPNLSKVRYPRDVCCPRYICPHCEQPFLYQSLSGLVTCPFCYMSIAVGTYNKRQMVTYTVFGSILLGITAGLTVMIVTLAKDQVYLAIPALMLFFCAIIFFSKALQSKDNYEEARLLSDDV